MLNDCDNINRKGQMRSGININTKQNNYYILLFNNLGLGLVIKLNGTSFVQGVIRTIIIFR